MKKVALSIERWNYLMKINNMVKKFIFIVVLLLSCISNAQYSLTGGVNGLTTFGGLKKFGGFGIGFESPKDNEETFYVRMNFYSKRMLDSSLGQFSITMDNIDKTDFTVMSVIGDSYLNYITIDGGTRYYLFDGYDSGFSLYGGSNVMGVINQAKLKLHDYDHSKYRLPAGASLTGTVLNLGVGFNGGAKYTFPGIGSIFLDANINYLLLSIPSNDVAKVITPYFTNGSPLLFTVNLGFRKDFY